MNLETKHASIEGSIPKAGSVPTDCRTMGVFFPTSDHTFSGGGMECPQQGQMEGEGGHTVHTARSTQRRCIDEAVSVGVLAKITSTCTVKRR